MKSKFVALAAAGKETEWLKKLLLDISLWFKSIAPISIRCDSVATLAKAYSQMYNGKFRHLGVMHNMIRELITNGVVYKWGEGFNYQNTIILEYLNVNCTKLGRIVRNLVQLWVQFIPDNGTGVSNSGLKDIHQGVIHQTKYPQRVNSSVSLFSIELSACILSSELAECSGC
ncbi:hypothetical protein Tco_1222974 [Tanacetum coccineum]